MIELLAPFDFAPYRFSGTVYGTLLNHRAALAALGDAPLQPPYKSPPRGPVLYVKPRNTLAAHGSIVPLDPDVEEFEVGATLGILIGQVASGVQASNALACIAGYAIVADLTVPHQSFYRPSLRFKVRDGSCLMALPVPVEVVPTPDDVSVRVWIDDQFVHETSTSGMLRPVERLLADVTEFMTLSAGDLLLLGVAAGAPRARRGQHVAIEMATQAGSLGRLGFSLGEVVR